jgi:transcriptional antiterminator RfaH
MIEPAPFISQPPKTFEVKRDPEDPWYVVYTKPKMESLAMTHLERQGFECYGPKVLQERILRKKRVAMAAPLFPRYLFIRPMDQEALSLYPVRSTVGVSNLVTFGDQRTPGKIPSLWIEALRGEEAKRQGEPLPDAFQKGEKVLILEGPFQGLLGVFDLQQDRDRVMVLIDFLGKATRLPLDPSALEKAPL